MNKEKKKIACIGLILLALSYLSMKISVPALPFLYEDLNTKPINLRYSATLYLVVFALSQLFWGTLGAFHRRRHLIMGGVWIAIIGSIVTMLSSSITFFILGRVLEAFGMGVASCLCRMLLTDRFTKHEITHTVFFFGLITSFMPFIAPTIGQYLLLVASWRFIFATITLVLLIYFFWMFFQLEETSPEELPEFRFVTLKLHMHALFSSRFFWIPIVPYALFGGAILGYYMSFSYWFRVHFHISDRIYTFLTLFTALPNIFSYYFSRRVIVYIGAKKCFRYALFLSPLPLLTAFFLSFKRGADPFSLIVPMMFLAFILGWIQPAVNTMLLHHFRAHAGVVAASLPVFSFLGTALMFMIFTAISLSTLMPFTLILCALGVIGCLFAFLTFLLRE